MSGLISGVIIVACALALAAIPIVALVQAVRSSSIPTPRGYSRPSPLQSLLANDPPSRCAPGVTLLTVALHQVDLVSGALVANLSLCMGSTVAKQLSRDSAKANPGVPTLTVLGFESTFSAPLVPIAKAQVSSGGTAQSIGSVTLPLDGNPRGYPLDHYEAQITAQTIGTCVVGVGDPLLVSVAVDPGVGNFDWSYRLPSEPLAGVPGPPMPVTGPQIVTPSGLTPIGSGPAPLGPGARTSYGGNSSEPCVGAATPVVVAAGRPTSTRWLVVLLVAIPLLLIILLALGLRETHARSVDGLVGVAAIMLAILPIRVVLVPSDITSLTLVDFWLATEMVALAAVAVLWWFVWARQSARGRASRSRSRRRR